jgi:hypothetical protein
LEKIVHNEYSMSRELFLPFFSKNPENPYIM